MERTRTFCLVALLGALALRPAGAQEPVFGTAPRDTTMSGPARPDARATSGKDSAASATAAGPRVPPEIAAMDSVTYQLAPASRLDVKTGKGGLIGFAGHSHVIHA